jgi:uncharacterized protein (DUF736 family)
MAYTPKENTGVLFKNNKKTDDKQPDYTGNILVGSTEMRLAAWIKEGKNGKFLSVKISESNAAAAPQTRAAANAEDDLF